MSRDPLAAGSDPGANGMSPWPDQSSNLYFGVPIPPPIGDSITNPFYCVGGVGTSYQDYLTSNFVPEIGVWPYCQQSPEFAGYLEKAWVNYPTTSAIAKNWNTTKEVLACAKDLHMFAEIIPVAAGVGAFIIADILITDREAPGSIAMMATAYAVYNFVKVSMNKDRTQDEVTDAVGLLAGSMGALAISVVDDINPLYVAAGAAAGYFLLPKYLPLQGVTTGLIGWVLNFATGVLDDLDYIFCTVGHAGQNPCAPANKKQRPGWVQETYAAVAVAELGGDLNELQKEQMFMGLASNGRLYSSQWPGGQGKAGSTSILGPQYPGYWYQSNSNTFLYPYSCGTFKQTYDFNMYENNDIQVATDAINKTVRRNKGYPKWIESTGNKACCETLETSQSMLGAYWGVTAGDPDHCRPFDKITGRVLDNPPAEGVDSGCRPPTSPVDSCASLNLAFMNAESVASRIAIYKDTPVVSTNCSSLIKPDGAMAVGIEMASGGPDQLGKVLSMDLPPLKRQEIIRAVLETGTPAYVKNANAWISGASNADALRNCAQNIIYCGK